jgi:hypothetical protein
LTFNTNSVSAGAVDDEDGYSGSWSVTAYAICANPLPGLQVVAAFSAFNSDFFKAPTAFCPAGTQVLAAGWSVFNGAVATEQLLNIHADISGGGPSPGVTGFGSEDANGYSGNWQMFAEAMCANP